MSRAESEFYSDIFRKAEAEATAEAEGFARGEAKGAANVLLTVLSARNAALTDTQKQRITDCRDPAQLDTWISRALSIRTADELFDGPWHRVGVTEALTGWQSPRMRKRW